MINRQISIDDANVRLKSRPMRYSRPRVGSIGLTHDEKMSRLRAREADMDAILILVRNGTVSKDDALTELYRKANELRGFAVEGDKVANFQNRYYNLIYDAVVTIPIVTHTTSLTHAEKMSRLQSRERDMDAVLAMVRIGSISKDDAIVTLYRKANELRGFAVEGDKVANFQNRYYNLIYDAVVTIPPNPSPYIPPYVPPVDPIIPPEEEEEEPLFAGDMTLPIIAIGALGIGALFLMMRRK